LQIVGAIFDLLMESDGRPYGERCLRREHAVRPVIPRPERSAWRVLRTANTTSASEMKNKQE